MEKETQPLPLTMAFSLLWPRGRNVDAQALSPESANDLETQKLIGFIAADGKNQAAAAEVFKYLCQDPETINYRLDIIDDLRHFPMVARCWEELLPVINEMRFYTTHVIHDDWSELTEVIWRMRELEHYIECIERLHRVFSGAGDLGSRGLKTLGDLVMTIKKDPVFERLKNVLPEMLGKINNVKSITIGVNLNAGLIPCEATLVSLNSEKYSDAPLYGRLIGGGGLKGIAQLHTTPEETAYANPLMIPLFRDIAGIMRKIIRPLARGLKEFVSINSRLIVKLQQDFLFYIGVLKVIRMLTECGLPMVRPTILSKKERRFAVRDLYNINLAVHFFKAGGENPKEISRAIVKNDFTQGDDGRIIILTGPNRGGKTTFLQAVGLAQILAQIGMYVPAGEAVISIADNIFTHYPAREELEKGTGRFGEEAVRLHAIFESSTRFSLILLNESLSSTSIGESLFLAQDLARVLRRLGTRVIYTTHLHQLASSVDEINADTPGESRLMSMVATVRRRKDAGEPAAGEAMHIIPTFKIMPGPPEGQSYALELASRFGISKDQLLDELAKRGEIS